MSIPTVERRRFKVGKYDIIANPIPNSAHMLRYTVFVGGKRIGATVSVPTESDCRFLEKPPVVPPLKIFSSYRPGRPKKGSRPQAPNESGHPARESLPLDVSLGGIRASTER
jgi:hypothetical protein